MARPPSLFRSVRGRLILLVAAISLPAMLLATVLIYRAYKDQRMSAASSLQGTARAITRVIDGEIDEADMMLKTLASGNALSQDDLATFDTVVRRALAGDSRWFVMAQPGGQQVLNTRVPFGTPLPGIKIEPELADTLRAGKTYVSNLISGPLTKSLVVYVCRPYIRDGKFVYGLSLAMQPGTLSDALKIQQFAPGSVLTIADRNGVIIARNRSPERFVGVAVTPDIKEAIRARSEGVVESVTLEHIPVLTAFSRARDGWTVVIGAPKSALFAPARHLLFIGFGSVALLALLAFAIALWIGHALIRSVDALTVDAATMAQGQMPGDLVNVLEETAFVGHAMRRTAETLFRRTRTLEALNRVSAALVAQRDPDAIIAAVTQAGREISGATSGACFKLQVSVSARSYFMVASATSDSRIFSPSEPLPAAIAEALNNGHSVRIGDITTLDGFSGRMAEGEMTRFKSFLAMPIIDSSRQITAWLVYVHSEANVFNRESEENILGLAAEAAIAIENAKLYLALAHELEAKTKAESELRVAQQRLHEYAQELERKVEERTSSLRDAISQMEEFSYTVSHDLRSPLRALNGYASILIEDYGPLLDETGREHLNRIQRASARMDQLTTDVLSYSRVTRAEVVLSRVNVESVVRSLIEHYGELQPGSAEIKIIVPMHHVFAHEVLLTQCLANLLTNAAKFVRPGEKPQITVSTELRSDRVRIWVEDRGIGIPPQYQATLFKIFERIPTKQTYDGTGVGLAIVRKACEKMGGRCGADSDGISGSRFWVELAAAM